MVEALQELMGFDISILIFLIFGAILAGLVDAICGGGGLISVPVLLMAGFTPAQAIAANKLQVTRNYGRPRIYSLLHKKRSD